MNLKYLQRKKDQILAEGKLTDWPGYNTPAALNKEKEIANKKFSMQQTNLNSEDYLRRLEQTLLSSINYQTISDVPIGTFLSGGIDSSLITALLQSQRKNPISSFTISFPDDNFA